MQVLPLQCKMLDEVCVSVKQALQGYIGVPYSSSSHQTQRRTLVSTTVKKVVTPDGIRLSKGVH